ncbi:MAG: hypothetical protein UY34_C0024G0010, partial [Parcubacteria group bacterium GW2011_GWA2_48_9]
MSLPKLLSLEQVSDILGVHPNTLRNWDIKGKLKAIRVGTRRDRRYEREQIETTYYQLHGRLSDGVGRQVAPKIFSPPVAIFALVHVVVMALFFHVSAMGVHDTRVGQEQGIVLGTTTDLFRLEPTVCEGWTELDAIPSEILCGGYVLPEKFTAESQKGVLSLSDIRVLISLGIDGYAGSEDVLTFSYSIDGKRWIPIDSFGLIEDMSNATHQGYWSFPMSVDSLSDISSLQVKASYNAVPSAEESVAYLDGMIIEANLEQLDETSREIVESVELPKTDFTSEENPTVSVAVEERSALSFIGIGTTQREVEGVTLTSPDGTKADVEVGVQEKKEGGTTTLAYSVPQDQLTRPGQYTISMNITQDGETEVVTKDFSWGVLAVNPNQSVYAPGQDATFSIGVLDDKGGIVCDAEVELVVTDSTGAVAAHLSTKDGSISVSDVCHIKDIYTEPDYTGSFSPKSAGTYQMELTATHTNGTHSIRDTFIVEERPSFTVKRTGPTRVFPVLYQPMQLEVTAQEDFEGEIIERVPADFVIRAGNDGKVRQADTEKEIVWNSTISAGDTITLGYEFKSPEKSPELFHVGEVTIGDWHEGRKWQLAIDPTYMHLLLDTGDSTPTGWTDVTATYTDKFIRGETAANFGATGGGATHTHSPVITQNLASTGKAQSGSANWRTAKSHDHALSGESTSSENNLPAYRNFKIIKNDTGIPATIPQNGIALFDDNPGMPGSGWTRQSSQDSKMIRIDSVAETLGSDTHTHTQTWSTLDADAEGLSVATNNTAASGSDISHTHTAPTSSATASATSLPPYIEVIVGKADANTSVPSGTIGLFDADPGAGWDLRSDSGDHFYQQFARGAAAYNSTSQGASTHTHTGLTSGVSGAAASATGQSTAGSNSAGNAHTHTLTANFDTIDHKPPYVNFVYAEKVDVTNIDISGSIKGTNESSFIGNPPCNGSTAVVSIRVDGGAESTTTCANSTGNFSFTAVNAGAGKTITLYLNSNSTPKANLIMVSGGVNITGADLYEDRMIVRDEQDGTATILDLLDYDNDQNATDMLFDADDLATDALTVDSGKELHIWTGDTLDPGGTVTTQGSGNLHIDDNATAQIDNGSSAIAGDVLVDGGATFSVQANVSISGGDITTSGTSPTVSYIGTPTVTMSGTGSVGGGTTPSITFYNLTQSSGSISLSDAVVTDNNFSVSGGTFTPAPNSDLKIKNDFTLTAGTTFTKASGSGKLIFNGDLTFTDNTSPKQDLGNVQIGLSPDVIELASDMVATSLTVTAADTFNTNGYDLDIGTGGITIAGIFDATDDIEADTYINTEGVFDIQSGATFTQGDSTVTFDGASGTDDLITNGAFSLYNLVVNGSSEVVELEDPLDVDNNITITNGTLDVKSGEDNAITIGGNWDNNSTFTSRSGTVTFDAADMSNTIEAGGSSFNNVTFQGSDGAGGWTFQTNDATVAGTIDVDTSDEMAIASGRTVTHSGSTLTLDGIISGAGRLTYQSGTVFPMTGWISSILRIDGTSADRTVPSRTFGGPMELYSNSSSAARTFTMGSAASQEIVIDGYLYAMADNSQNVTVEANTYNPSITVRGDLDFTGSGGGSETLNAGSNTWSLGGNVNFSDGTFTHNSGTVKFIAGDTGNTINADNDTFNNVQFGTDWLTGYSYRQKVSFDASALSGSVSNFPVMVHVDNSSKFSSFWSHVTDTTNGYDIVFTDRDGTVLDYHFEKFNYAGSDLVAWVEMPQLDASRTDYLYMYYGRASAPNQLDENGTYDSDGSFVDVQHLEESPNDGVAGHINSVSSSYAGTPQNFQDGGGGTTDATGRIDGADDFAGDDDYVNTTYNAALDPDSITWSAWVQFADLSGSNYGGVLSRNNGNDAYNIMLVESTDRVRFYVKKAAASTCGGGWSCVEYGTSVNTSDWYLLTLTHNGGTGRLEGFVNGDSIGSDTVVGAVQKLSSDVRIGHYAGGTYADGIIDEMKLSNTVRSNDWIKAEYLSESETLIVNSGNGWSAEETGAAGAWSPLTNAMTVTNDLTMTAGTFNTASGTADVTVNGNVTCGATCGTISMTTTNTFTQSVSASKNFGTTTGTTAWTFNNLTFQSSANTPTITFNAGTGLITVNSTLTLTNGGTSLTVDNETSNDRDFDLANVTIGTTTEYKASSTEDFTVSGDWTLNGTFTRNSGTVTFDPGDSNSTLEGSTTSFNNLTINPSSSNTVTTNISVNVYGVLNVAANDTLSIASAKQLIQQSGSLTLSGTIGGAGKYRWYLASPTDLPTTGIISCTLSYEALYGNQNIVNRTYDGPVEIHGDPVSTRTDTASSGTLTFNSTLTTYYDGASFTLDFVTNNPIVVVVGDFTNDTSAVFSAPDADGSFTLSANYTNNGTFTHNNGEVIFNSPTTAEISTGGTGIGQLFYNVEFNGSDTSGTWTVTPNDMEVKNNIVIDILDIVEIPSSRRLRQITNTGTLSLDGEIMGDGRFEYASTTEFPGTGDVNVDVQFYSQYGNQKFAGRVFGGDVEFVGWSGVSRTFTANDSNPVAFDGNVTTTDVDTAFTLDFSTNNPAVTIGGTLTLSSLATFSASSATYLQGSYVNNGTFTDSGGTVYLNGSSTQTLSGTMTGSSDFNNLTITNTSGSHSGCETSFTPGIEFAADMTVSGTYRIVTTDPNPDGIMRVEYLSGSTYIITNINWVGTETYPVIFRNSNLTSGTWNLNVSGTQAVSWVDVARSDATPGSIIDADDGTNADCGSPPNVDWDFEAPRDFAGFARGTGESGSIGDSICNGSTAVLTLRINGADNGSTSCALTTGAYSFTGITVSTGDTATIYLNGASASKANLVFVHGGTNLTDADLYQDRVIARDNFGGVLTISEMADWDNDDDSTNMLFTANTNLVVEDNYELHIWTGDTLDPGGTVTTGGTGDVHVDDSAIVYFDTATNTVGDDILVDAGATLYIDANTSVNGGAITTTTTGVINTTGGTPTLTMSGTGAIGGGSGAITIYNLTTTGTGTTSLTGTGTNTISNDVSVGTGTTLDIQQSVTVGGGDLTTTGSGSITTTSGTPLVTINTTGTLGGDTTGTITIHDLTFGSGTHTFGSEVTVNDDLTLAGDITPGTSTVTMAGTDGAATLNGAGGNSDFNNLTIDSNAVGTTITLSTGDVDVTGALAVDTGDTLSISSERMLRWQGSGFTLNGTISGAGRLTVQTNNPIATSGTLSTIVRFDVANNAGTMPARTYGSDVEIYSNKSCVA